MFDSEYTSSPNWHPGLPLRNTHGRILVLFGGSDKQNRPSPPRMQGLEPLCYANFPLLDTNKGAHSPLCPAASSRQKVRRKKRGVPPGYRVYM